MKTLTIKTGTEEDFFARGRDVAQRADHSEVLPEYKTLSFEDPEDVLQLLTPARLALFRAVKEGPGSITSLAMRLHRDRSAVKRDVDALAKAGLLEVESQVSPGHGRLKFVHTTAQRFQLEAQLV